MATLTYYCWHCYGENVRADGACVRCGRQIEPPSETTYDDRLLWALHHPIAENRMTAIQLLGSRRERRARAALRALALDTTEPYVAAEALKSLIAIDGAAAMRGLLETLASSSPPLVRRVARQALEEIEP